MNNTEKLNFIKQFNIIGEGNENNVEYDLQNCECGTIKEAFADYWDEIGEYLNPESIPVCVVADFAQDYDEYNRMFDEIDSEAKIVYTTDDCEVSVMEHPIIGRYLDIDCGNPGLVFLFDK